MASKTTFIVQAFEMKRGKLVPGSKEVAPTASGAEKRAKAIAERVPGAAAICITADDETGELHAATFLATFGQIPDDFAESLLDR